MRIAILGPTYPFRGGIAHYTTALYLALLKKHEASLFSFKKQYPSFLFPGVDERDGSDAPLKTDSARRILNPLNPFSWITTFLAIRRTRPDVLVIPWWVAFWGPPFFAIALLMRLFSKARIVFICHNVIEHETSAFRRFITKRVLGRGHAFIVHSSPEARNLKQVLPRADIKVCSLPALELCKSAAVDRREAREKLGLGANGRVLLFFGFVRHYKGLDILIEALPRIRERRDATLLVAGEFWRDRDEYLQRIEKLGLDGCVLVHDRYIRNEEISLYFAAADVVVLPYRSATGTGVVPLAYSFGVPVVAGAVGCLPEVVRDGETGFLVPPENPEALAGAVVRCLEEETLAALGRCALAEREKFSWDSYVAALESLAGDCH